MPKLPRVDDEVFALAEEIAREAQLEIIAELLRRGIRAESAQAIAIITMFSGSVAMAQALHAESGNPGVAKEFLHTRLDEVWETVRAAEDDETAH